MRILNSFVVSKIRSCKPGCTLNSPAAHFLCSTARIPQYISTASFWSYKLLWSSDECVLLPCFNALLDIFAVTNCCVAALSLFSSDILTWSADSYIQCNDTQNKGRSTGQGCGSGYFINGFRFHTYRFRFHRFRFQQNLDSNRAWALSHLWTCWQAWLSKPATYDLQGHITS